MKKQVYDIVNAGPRHRFTVRSKTTKRKKPLVVSNCENVVQALSRDVFGWQLAQMYMEGIKALWTVHDEAILEVKLGDIERVKERVVYWMTQTPPWMPQLPLGCDCGVFDKYEKG